MLNLAPVFNFRREVYHMIDCSQCLNNLANGNINQIRTQLEVLLEECELDAPATMEILQARICESCKR